MYGSNGGMMGFFTNSGGISMLFGWVIMILFWVLVIAGIIFLVQWILGKGKQSSSPSGESATEICPWRIKQR